MPARWGLALACGLVAGSLFAESLIKESERKRAPDFVLSDADGNTTRLSDYHAKVVVLDFWATWCQPCKIEIPWFNEFEEKHKDQGFAVIGISRDEDGWKKVKPFIKKMRMRYRVLLGDPETSRLYGDVHALPVTFLIDRQRRVAAVHFGLVSKKKLDEQIRQLLETPASSQ